MRILHIIASVNPEGGGPIEGIKQMAREASTFGSIMEVLSLDDPAAPWVESFPLKVYALGPVNWLSKKLNYYYKSGVVAWLRAHGPEYDAVIVNGLWMYHSLAVWRALRKSSVPYFVFTHGMLDPWFKHTYPLKHLKKWLYWPWAEYRVLRDAKSVLFTCEEERILARQSFWLYHCDERVVGYGTAAPVGDAELQREAFLDAFPGLRGKRLLLFISRIHPKKGCDLLIEAFSQVAAQDASLHLVMAGPDQTGWKQDLVAQSEKLGIADRITWTGMLSGDEKWGAYHAAEVFTLTSHQENFGIVVVEAMACGTPVLISNKVNIWREIEVDGAGLVANDDLAGAIEVLQKWIDMTAEDRQRLNEKTLECFLKRFEIGTSTRELYRVMAGMNEDIS